MRIYMSLIVAWLIFLEKLRCEAKNRNVIKNFNGIKYWRKLLAFTFIQGVLCPTCFMAVRQIATAPLEGINLEQVNTAIDLRVLENRKCDYYSSTNCTRDDSVSEIVVERLSGHSNVALSDEQLTMLADAHYGNDTYKNEYSNYIYEPSLLSLINGKSNRSSFKDVLIALEDWRSRNNISVRVSSECSALDYCSGEFRDVILAYNSIHGYVSLLICLFGSLANALNVAVLTRRDLAAAPINRLLKWLAVADVFVMMEYVPFAIYRYLILPGQEERPHSWAVYMLFHMHFTQILHTASILLTLSLAVWRYIAIKYPAFSPTLCTDRRCSMAILISFILPPILCIPSYFVFTIHKDFTIDRSSGAAMKVYFVDSDYDGSLYQINFWVHAVFIKLLPCVILTVISAWLIRALYRANSRKKALKSYNACPTDTVVNGNGNIFTRKSNKRSKAERRTDRTTKMLLAVLLLFLLTEFPQGILGLLSGLLGRCFFKRCYDLFGELMDVLALLNGAINFVLYCSMSRQFRTSFGQIVRARCAPAQRAASHTELQTTFV